MEISDSYARHFSGKRIDAIVPENEQILCSYLYETIRKIKLLAVDERELRF